MAAAKKPTTKKVMPTVAKKATNRLPATEAGNRRLPLPKRRNRKLRKQLKTQTAKLPNVWRLTKQTAATLWRHKRLFGGIIIIYGLLNLVLVQGLANNSDIATLKTSFSQAFHGTFGRLASGLGIFVVLVGSAGNGSSDTAGAYQLFLGLLVSLALVWSLRQTQAGVGVRVRDAYYRGMYPLVPVLLVLAMVVVQLLPLIIGTSLYSAVVSNGIAVNGFELLIFGLIAAALALWSLYLISASLFALYIVTLPDMTPLKALRSAKQLVRYRRWTVLRKLLFLPLALLIVAAVIMLPIILWLTPAAQWVFFVLTMVAVAAIHTYMYGLYRELLNE